MRHIVFAKVKLAREAGTADIAGEIIHVSFKEALTHTSSHIRIAGESAHTYRK